MARDGEDRLASISLLAAQTDFTEAGELQLFTDESQLALLDDVMWRQGYLDSGQMAGAFQMLRSNDLIWSHLIRAYLLGQREEPERPGAWNADATRMPYRMHSEYLHSMFLRQRSGRGPLHGRRQSGLLRDIALPLFVVGTESDHVAPWHSVYKIHLLNSGDITFVLTSGGHNAGIVSEPGHPHRHFRQLDASPAISKGAGGMAGRRRSREGSWWPAWTAWLDDTLRRACTPAALGRPKAGYPALEPAPGRYVHATI